MKTKVILMAALLVVGLAGFSQNLGLPKTGDLKKAGESVQKTAAPAANAGSLVSQLTSNISDKSLTDSFNKQKPAFTDKAGKTADPAGLGNSLAALGGGLKPEAMDAGWGAVKDKFIKDAKSATTIKTVAGLAGQLESHIKPTSFKGTWAQARPAWQTALSTLSK